MLLVWDSSINLFFCEREGESRKGKRWVPGGCWKVGNLCFPTFPRAGGRGGEGEGDFLFKPDQGEAALLLPLPLPICAVGTPNFLFCYFFLLDWRCWMCRGSLNIWSITVRK